MFKDYFLIIPILLPVFSGLCAALSIRKGLSDGLYRFLLLTALIGESICVVIAAVQGGALRLFAPLEEVNFILKVDDLSRVFSIIAAAVWLFAGVYAGEYMKEDKNRGRFFTFYLSAEGMVIATCFAANMVTFYMFFEMMTILTFPLVMHDLTKPAIRAGLKYIFYSVAGAFMTLFGIFTLRHAGILNPFNPGGSLDIEAVYSNDTLFFVAVMLMIVGLGIKAGSFPLHAWLPAAHPEAPAPASAVLSGIITKTGVLGTIRVVYYVTGTRLLAGTWVQTTWMALALITVVMGSMMAYREQVFKKRLAYSTVSQVAYVMFGLSVMNSQAFTGAVSHVIFHALIKTTLFLVSGVLIHTYGSTRVSDFKACGKVMPVTMLCYTIVSIALIGIPPMSGFVSKWYLATGALMLGREPYYWLGPAALLLSALLTAGYLLPLTVSGFFPGKGDAKHGDASPVALPEKEEPGALSLIPMIIMSVATVALGILPGPLTDFIEMIAGNVF